MDVRSMYFSVCGLCIWFTLSVTLPVFVYAFSGQPQSSKNPVRVLVTGAAGKTGRIVLSKLEEDHRYEPKGLFRTERSARRILKNVDTKCSLEHVVVADVTSPTFLDDLASTEVLQNEVNAENNNTVGQEKKGNGLEKMDAMIICTSAVPRIRKRSLVGMLVKAPWRALKGEQIMDIRSMRFTWKHGGYPEKVDYLGQKAQIDLAKRLKIPHVILVSSMGGTDPDNFLNSVGKRTSQWEKDGHGDILLWKRKAEKYLVESGLDYTILHPGGLVDTAGGQNDFVFGVDDTLYELNHQHQRAITRISRDDLAELCVAALNVGKGKKASFDCITLPVPVLLSLKGKKYQNPETVIFSADLVHRLKTKVSSSTASELTTTAATPKSTIPKTVEEHELKSAEDALGDFLNLAITTNYRSDLIS